MSNTELIDRYLNALKLWLPRKQQADILAELTEDIHSQMEEREAALGRPLGEEELVALLQRRGSPMRVASGYLPDQRLMSPAMLPLYRMVLKIVLLWALLPLFGVVFIGPILQAENAGLALLRFCSEAWRTGFMVIGMVTVGFWLFDRYHSTWLDRWDPRKLPRIARSHQQMQWYNDFAGFVFGAAALVFWAVFMRHRSEFVFDTGFRIGLAPIWGQLYWLILALTLARAAANLYCFLRPTWSELRSWIRLGLDALDIIVPLVLLRVATWVQISGPHLAPADAAKVVALVNGAMQVTLISIPVITLFDVFRQGRLLWRAKSGRSTPALAV